MSEWQMVLDPYRGGYAAGFDPNAVYQFKRVDGHVYEPFRMADVHPAFNVAGLLYRSPPKEQS